MALPIIGPIMEGNQAAHDLHYKKREMEVGVDLENRARRIENRKVVGSYVSDVGASGVDLTLDEINEVNREYALDIAIADDYKKRQGQMLDSAADRAKMMGKMNAVGDIIGLATKTYTPSAPIQAGSQAQATNTATSQSIDTNTTSMMKKKNLNGLNSQGTGSLSFGSIA